MKEGTCKVTSKKQGAAPIFGKIFTFAKNNTAQLKIIRFYSSKKKRKIYVLRTFFIQ
jgi:hypothetical protein